jgi:hypothetical protein
VDIYAFMFVKLDCFISLGPEKKKKKRKLDWDQVFIIKNAIIKSSRPKCLLYFYLKTKYITFTFMIFFYIIH